MKMNKDEGIQDYTDKLLKLVNQLRQLGEEVSDKRIVNKILVSILERFEAKIFSLEDLKDLTKIFVNEIINALLAQEQRIALRDENFVESALVARTKGLKVKGNSSKKNDGKGSKAEEGNKGKATNKYLSCPSCKKRNHIAKYYCKWKATVDAEMSMIIKNGTWTLVDKPVEKNVIGVKWIYRTKLNSDGSINKYKAKPVVKGYAQVYEADYMETYAPIARHNTIRMLVALVAREEWKLFHLDVKLAFLNGYLTEDIYVDQLEGYEQWNSKGYSDSDWAGSLDDSNSTGRFCFSFGSAVFAWNSKKQHVVA
ncbi:Cysteine-rich RLK (RECEPTOR-like protein kinase) 8 [Theobroma cacao]|uniref:Cysteine-rich RLK (RECEPTOR-like protein kinase) 8 n=1 Tax=Theobroma cacao TaxID=3641 RepID=A0A061F280_THECC|nr:Cysteine-rich RLK (RECEPTOR-like protein kinase) 8 [Theobroma cacao]